MNGHVIRRTEFTTSMKTFGLFYGIMRVRKYYQNNAIGPQIFQVTLPKGHE